MTEIAEARAVRRYAAENARRAAAVREYAAEEARRAAQAKAQRAAEVSAPILGLRSCLKGARDEEKVPRVAGEKRE